MSPIIRKFEKRFPWFRIPGLVEGLLGLQVVGFFLSVRSRDMLQEMVLVGGLVLQGEIWRVLSFLAVPPTYSVLFLFFALYLFYLYGNSLRDFWGETALSLFFLVNFVLTCAASFIQPFIAFTNAYILTSFFLAFAMVNPNFELRLFFILPIQVKWLALVTWLWYAVSFFTDGVATKLQISAVVITMLIFFWEDIYFNVRRWLFGLQKKREAIQQSALPLHQCSVCGKTDRDSPTELFRYKMVEGTSRCFCEDHLPRAEASNS